MDGTELLGFDTGALCEWLTVRRRVWHFPVGIANGVFQASPAVVVRERSVVS
ncbi:MAG: nicotinamide mononucleotide transporter family protein [Humibacillus sp.]|nr:nicotinamide mononucleotide transporter family protein [Humibacillus sp.]MDN5778053.1 nicotinamide mononucleotide transporter family protein [Humibacillus sp.]